MNVSQYLAVNAYAKEANIRNDRIIASSGTNDLPARCPSPPVTPLMAQLIEMGFSKKAVESAMKATNESPEVNIDRLVAWLLEYPEEGHLAGDSLNSLDKNEREIIKKNVLKYISYT